MKRDVRRHVDEETAADGERGEGEVLNRAETVTAVNNVHLRPNVSRVETTNISAGNSVIEAIVNVLNTSNPRASRHLMCPS